MLVRADRPRFVDAVDGRLTRVRFFSAEASVHVGSIGEEALSARGFTLPELIIVITVFSTLLAIGWTGVRDFREASALQAAARRVTAQLSLARRLAVNRRETVRLRTVDRDLALTFDDGRVLFRLALDGPDRLPVDSVDVRPSTMRFNERGQAAPGSVYLYRGRRSIRIVCNFLGRLRVEGVEWSS